MRSKSLLTLILLTPALLFSSCSNEPEESNEDESLSVIPVEVSNVARGDISAYYSNTATLEAEEEAMVVAKVRGLVDNILVEEGDQVRKGQVIAQLEKEQFEIELNRARATMERLQNEYERNQELFDKQLIAAETFQASKYEYETQKANFELAKLNLQNTSITSPISGVVSERMIKEGNMIGVDQEVFRVTDFSPLLAILYVPEHEMSKIRKNQLAVVQVDALPGESFDGRVGRISPIVDPETGTFKVTVFLNENGQRLRPGMFGRVKIVYDTRQNTQMIPKSAVISEDLAQSVYVIRDSMAFKKQINTGYANGVNIEVLSGLEEGDLVVTIGQGSLRDSTKVNIIKNL